MKERIPEWAGRERLGDLEWIGENLHVFWPAAQQQYREQGRGALVVDTTSRPTGGGHPFSYLNQEELAVWKESEARRMVAQYDPAYEFVAVLLKSGGRTSIYRIALLNHPTSADSPRY